LRYHCHLKAETTNTKGYKRRARRQFVWPVCRAYGTGRRASVKDCKVCPLKGVQISLIMPSNGLGLLFFKNNPFCFRQACLPTGKPADNILLLLAHGRV